MADVCATCGEANPASVQFCLFCGAFLDWSERSSDDPTEPRPVVPEPPLSAPVATRVGQAPAATADDEPVLLPSVRRTQPAASAVLTPPMPGLRTPVQGTTCPACGRANAPDLHFCARCGRTLREEPAAPVGSAAPGWRRMLEDRDRRARREYRRSLPPLYRWRRVLIGVLVPALVVGGLVAVGRHPVRWVQERWWDVRGTTVAVTGVSAATTPANASKAGSDPASLVDGTEQAWSEPWNPAAEGAGCGGAEGTGAALLRFPATRVREIDVNAGLPAGNPSRPLEFRPQAIGVRFDSGPCHRFTLADVADLQRLEVDSGTPVTSVTIGVDTTFPARSDGARVLSLTEVGLRSRPS